jgi:spore maturation protein CgeB
MNKSLKILHCANFSTFKNAQVYYSMDRKISYGLIQNGHLVYDFSYRDIARAQRFLGFKKKSIQKMNQDLIEHCKNIKPDLLLLGKCELINSETLKDIKNSHENIKIAKWFVDFIASEQRSFMEQFNFIDYFFKTSPKDLLNVSKTYKNTVFSMLPNISDPAFENTNSFNKEYDVIYIARDHKEDVRYKFAVMLNDFCKKHNLKLKIYASLGNPPIFGQEYYNEISKSKIAINFNRDDSLYEPSSEDKIFGSSDRMNHFMGLGTCCFSPRIKGFDKWFKDGQDIVYFDSVEDCFQKIKFYLKNENYKLIGNNGKEKVFNLVNSKRVTKYMLDLIFNSNEVL